ncbi:MAG: hypothetical protein IIA59_11895 [Candidatus Marinimicrobia bacterium]|nr:hypothetical protein [Candidatus Neomarinimicrobiota bacterium]
MAKYFAPFPSDWIFSGVVRELGKSVWLLLFLLDTTVKSIDKIGLVYGGEPLQDDFFTEELGIHRNTLARYRKRLEEAGFIYTRTVWGSMKQWFVIGTEKHTKLKATPKQVQLALSIRAHINNVSKSDLELILNPSFFDLLTNYNAPAIRSGEVSSNNVMAPPNNGAPIKDNTLDEKGDDGESRMMGPVRKKKNDLDDEFIPADVSIETEEVLQIYRAYMQLLGSNSETPDKHDSVLIHEALEHEGLDGLKGAINNYTAELEIRGDKWRVYSLFEFLKRDMYSRFLNTAYGTKPNYSSPDDDIPF